MANPMQEILERIEALQEQLEAEIGKRREAFRYQIENGRIVFEEEARRRHRELRIRLLVFLRRTRPMVVLTAPVIYSLIIPFVILDLFVTVYQAICFPIYGIPKVRRRDHIRIDRHHLAYLNALQKLNCVYCGYGNGLISFVREVASRTEAYWCPIKHAARVDGTHERYAGFMEFGDGEGFERGVAASRNKLRKEE
ncbi:MAG: hypothetical protein GYB25_09650 [Rhodobacteraceae bacterium]|nr:hypothetical protein [Paracoccaceae bacterium]